MTREEAIRILSTRDAHGVLCGYTSGVTEALDMAIEALSAKPTIPTFAESAEAYKAWTGEEMGKTSDEINEMNNEIIKDILKMMPTAYLLEALGVSTFEELTEQADRPTMTEEVREALMRLTMCAREECDMCKYEHNCSFDKQVEMATESMNIIANAFKSADRPHGRLIDAERLKDSIEKEVYSNDYIEHIYQIIDNAPTVSADRPTGEWIPSDIPNEKYVCSNCGAPCWYYDVEKDVCRSRFCPNCGAKMGGDGE